MARHPCLDCPMLICPACMINDSFLHGGHNVTPCAIRNDGLGQPDAVPAPQLVPCSLCRRTLPGVLVCLTCVDKRLWAGCRGFHPSDHNFQTLREVACNESTHVFTPHSEREGGAGPDGADGEVESPTRSPPLLDPEQSTCFLCYKELAEKGFECHTCPARVLMCKDCRALHPAHHSLQTVNICSQADDGHDDDNYIGSEDGEDSSAVVEDEEDNGAEDDAISEDNAVSEDDVAVEDDGEAVRRGQRRISGSAPRTPHIRRGANSAVPKSRSSRRRSQSPDTGLQGTIVSFSRLARRLANAAEKLLASQYKKRRQPQARQPRTRQPRARQPRARQPSGQSSQDIDGSDGDDGYNADRFLDFDLDINHEPDHEPDPEPDLRHVANEKTVVLSGQTHCPAAGSLKKSVN